MPRRARVECVSLRSSLVNLPVSIYGPLLERNIRPQSLAVHLSNANGVSVYVGWTGILSASSLAHFNSQSSFETVEIDPQYALSLGLSQGDTVDIGLLHDLPFANSVSTEPLTSDDWEIIELHASHVESTLLSQVRVANVGQEIDVWVLGNTRVRLVVVSIDPPTKGGALLLTTNTQVAIAPKPRTSKTVSVPAKRGADSALKKPLPFRQFLRVLPPRLLPPIAHDRHSGSEILALVSPYVFAELTHSPNPLLTHDPVVNPDDVKHTITYYKCTLRRLPPPRDPSKPSNESPVPVPQISQRTTDADKRGEANSSTAIEEREVYVGWSTYVPEKHIAPAVMWDGLEDWDNVQITLASSENATIGVLRSSGVLANGDPLADIKLPQTTGKTLAGIDDILNHCVTFCMDTLAYHASQQVTYGVPGLLIAGRSGTGKTSIVRAVAKTMQEDPRSYMHTIYVDFARYAEQSVATIKSKFRYWFEIAAWHRPTLLVFDNMHTLLNAEQEHTESFRTRHLTELFVSIFSSSARAVNPNTRGIMFLATAPSKATLHPLLGAVHLFKDIVDLKTPNRDVRKKILAHFVQQRLDTKPDILPESHAPLNYAAIASQTEGYAAVDLEDLVARAMHQAVMRAGPDVNANVTLDQVDFDAAHADFVPLSLRDVKLQKSEVAWADIGGLDEVKRILRETLEWPTKYAPLFAQAPLRLRSGLLLYGYPGCGKTLLASAIARECGLNFISVKGPEILNKYIGASEQSVRDLFERASAAKPCVLFFDEFDAIAPKRGHDSTGVTDRVVNQMLTEIDGAEGLDGVYVLAATSRPDLIDPALLRPGRLDKSLLCDMPSAEERKDILQAVSKKVDLSPDIDLEEFAQATEGFSGADLQALIYNAHLKVVHATIAASQAQGNEVASNSHEKLVRYVILGGAGEHDKKAMSRADEAAFQKELQQIRLSTSRSGSVAGKAKASDSNLPHKREIGLEHMRYALRTTRPSVSIEERARLSRIYHAFVSDRSGDLPVPPEARGIGNRVSLM